MMLKQHEYHTTAPRQFVRKFPPHNPTIPPPKAKAKLPPSSSSSSSSSLSSSLMDDRMRLRETLSSKISALEHRSLSGSRQKQKIYHKEGPPMPCLGLTSGLCHPCEHYGGPGDYCMMAAGQQCAFAFCHPMCLRLTWRVRVMPTGKGPTPTFAGEVAGPSVQEAIKTQFKAYGCAKMECCDGELMWDYVENYVYHAGYGEPAIPLHSCQHDVTDKEMSEGFCDACKESVEVVAEALDCTPDLTAMANADKDKEFIEVQAQVKQSQPVTAPQFNKHYDQEDIANHYNSQTKRAASVGSLGDISNSKSLHERAKKHLLSLSIPTPPTLDSHTSSSFVLENERIRVDMAALRERLSTKYDPGMDQGVHHTFFDRCMKLKAAVEGQLGGLVSDFQGKVCGCFGCCDDLCYFPTTINTIKQMGDIDYPTTSDMAAGWEPITDEDDEHYTAITGPN